MLKKKKKEEPKSWKDLTLRQGIELLKLSDMEDSLEMAKAQMGIALDYDEDYIERLPMAAVIDFVSEWSFLVSGAMPKEKKADKIEINGREYGLIDLDKMSLAQLIDIEELWAQGMIGNIHRILSAIYLPYKKRGIAFWRKKEFEDYELLEERAEDMLDVDMETIWGAALFFSNTVAAYLLAFRRSLYPTIQTSLDLTIQEKEELEAYLQFNRQSETSSSQNGHG